MSGVQSLSGDGLSESAWEQIVRACDSYEDAWRAGQWPRIEDLLEEVMEPEQSVLLRELLLLELELRRRGGERPTAAEYRARFPGYVDLIHAALRQDPGSTRDVRARPRARPTATDPARQAGLNLLFGVLALQNNFIGRDELLAAFAGWVADKARPLAQLLVDRGALDEARLALLEALVGEHLKQHGGDTEASLAAVSSLGSVREDLEQIGDPELHASLAGMTSRPAADTGATATYAQSSRRAGERFRILRFHREGGLGRIYVACDEELGREVALKEIRPDKVAKAELRDRFVLEAEINGGLEHPGIVPVYSLGTYDDGRPFYAMRFVEGDSLKEAIESYHNEHPRPDPAAVEFRKLLGRFIDVCEAIAFAHSKGVLHRDLKPQNVMLGRFGETLLIDWGLAKATGRREPAGPEAAWEATLVPPSGSGHAPTLGVLGSPPYMSPEQAAGAAESLGPATDVYGLGAILFALLTGEPPVEAGLVEEVLDRVRRGAIQSPRSLNSKIPGSLEAICLKALALKAGDRYLSARVLADDVMRWLADEPVMAWREPLAMRLRRWSRRHRTMVVGAAAALVAGVIGLSALAAVQAKANNDLREANAATTKAKKATEGALKQSEESRQQAEAVSTFLAEAFRSPDPSLDGRQVKVAEVLDRAGAKLDKEFAGSPVTKGALLNALGMTWRGLGLHDRAIGLHSKAATVREAALGLDHPETLKSRSNLAIAYAEAGRTSEAIELFDTLLKHREAALGPQHPDTLFSRNALAESYRLAGRLAEAIALHEATLKLREAALGPQHPDTLKSRRNLASAYMEVGRLSQAIALLEGTLKLCEAVLGPDHPETLKSRMSLALAYQYSGRLPEAIAMHKATLELQEAKLGPDHPDTLGSRNNLALAYWEVGRLPEAIALHEATLERFESTLGHDHPRTLNSRNNLARAYKAVGRYAEAIAMHEATLRLREATLGPDHPDTLITRRDLASAYHAAGRLSDAIALYKSTLELEAKLGPDQGDVIWTLSGLAAVYESLGCWAEAEAVLRDTLARRRKTVEPHRPRLADNLGTLGRILLTQSRWSEAEPLLHEALAIQEKVTPDDWSRYDTMTLLGASLLGQGRYAEAEPLIVSGYEGIKARALRIAVPERHHLREAAERVVRLYEDWGKTDQAKAWKERLGLADLPADVFARP
jgi:eukaryotic-like serine/threonine-protein kinase